MWNIVFDVAKNFLTCLAIFCGGVWAYWRFIYHRQHKPHANVTHRLTHVRFPSGQQLVHIDISIVNSGNILLRLISADVRVQQILPLHPGLGTKVSISKEEREISWPLIDRRLVVLTDIKPPQGLRVRRLVGKCCRIIADRIDGKEHRTIDVTPALDSPIDSSGTKCTRRTCEIEPGESQEIPFDFTVESCVEVIEVYSYVKNASKIKEIGWCCTTIHDLRSNK